LAFVVNFESVECDGWASDIAANFLELFPIRAAGGDAGMELGEAVIVGEIDLQPLVIVFDFDRGGRCHLVERLFR
jgi:hypothetical protein